MNTKAGWIIVIVVGAVIVVAGFFVWWAPSANNEPARSTGEEAPKAAARMHRILMKNNEFVPAELVINAGDEVVFVNEDEAPHWPASGVHPTHLLCPGFDALKGVKKGGSYSFVFSKPATCPMHDHLLPSMRGKIIVE